MAITPEGEKQLRWCADRALLEYDRGGANAALISIITDFRRNELTSSIDPSLVHSEIHKGIRMGRDKLEEFIMGFII